MMRISMGYPDPAAEAQMLRERDTANPLTSLHAVVDAARVRELIAWARRVHVSPPVEQYAVSLAQATRAHPDLRLGASPRATLQLVRAAKVWAALDSRAFVIPDDISALLVPVFAHRLIPTRATSVRGRGAPDTVTSVLQRLIATVPVPLSTGS
jgi:MoxR-like ATPase